MRLFLEGVGLVALGGVILAAAIELGVGMAYVVRHAAHLLDPGARIVAAKEAMDPIFRLIGE